MNIKNKFTDSTKSLGAPSVKHALLVLLIIMTVGGIGGTYYYYSKYQDIQNNPNSIAQKETEKSIAALGKLMELPKEETPTVATISDKEKLKWQVFFDAAENGDTLFAYTTAMKAILYRPSTNKIINVAPIAINPGQDLAPGTKAVTGE